MGKPPRTASGQHEPDGRAAHRRASRATRPSPEAEVE
jgi:hypothetical protein